MASTKPKSKLAYLSYDQIQPKIDAGLLDEYDLIFDKNSHEMLILDKDKNIVPVKSKIDSYQSVSDAETALNAKTDTYVGQIVNILVDGKYIPYSVNKDSSAVVDTYYVTRIGIDDYNDLKNKPIENIVANEEVILSELVDGVYSLVGNYRISELDATHRMVASKVLFVKQTFVDENNIEYVHITELGAKAIKNYICTEVSFTEDRFVLLSELGNEVEDIIQTEVPQIIDDYVENHSASTEDIQNLFNAN